MAASLPRQSAEVVAAEVVAAERWWFRRQSVCLRLLAPGRQPPVGSMSTGKASADTADRVEMARIPGKVETADKADKVAT